MAEQTFSINLSREEFDIDATLGCGQCFRWARLPSGTWEGVAFSRRLSLRREGKSVLFCGTSAEDFKNVWVPYFDLGRDYGALRREFKKDPVLREAVSFSPGIRLLRQEPWETLCSFIISQNNNIPRIRGIVSRLCEHFGSALPGGGFSFPAAQRLSSLDVRDLSPLRCGFRAPYLLDAARKVASGEIPLEDMARMPLGQAREHLMKIKGVGPKVAECTLLYGCGRAECFPVDVWIRRVLECFYPRGFPEEFRGCAGIAQQYLFHYARCCPSCELARKKGA